MSGSKNASLPIIAATILNADITKLYNIPKIQDTKITLEILKILGCKIRRNSDKIEINSKNMTKTEIPEDLMRQMRSTVILAGAILGRFKKVTFTYPGGCEIGARPIDLHLDAFKKMGVEVEEKAGFIRCSCDKIIAADINLDFPSVGATENIILAATLAEGTTTINNAAMEPEIIDLANCLNKMGAKIDGAGTNIIKITGVKKLKSIGYKVIPDRIEAGTFLCAAAVTGGNILIKNVIPEHIVPVIHKLQEAGCKIDIKKNSIEINAPKKLKSVDIKTMPYPGFPTDLQQIFGSMLSVAKGTSIIVENIFENRFKYVSELKRMGAKATIEGRTAIITGKRKLVGTTVKGNDLRGGTGLIIAALAAKGKTKVENVEYVLRGYENLDKKINLLGGNIKEVGE
ncbi:MAG: UDP-N-acetylglucosamine 1-carboxyvinyltransferase [Clostridia bacterium]|nr:UDP-N-acetylglucosamine 1-carboxyvinyltransferase [Clostridia bacterium]MBR4260356.1 UDP-N-acetylglucosamine 1-carboxyvinyltransferase [Clostridia bacterium]